MRGFFQPAPDAPPISGERIAREHARWRRAAFLSITLGYTIFYVTRLSTAASKDAIVADGVLGIADLGVIDSVFLATYAVGKTIHGFLADRASPRRMFATALFVSALANLVFGVSSTFAVLAIVWALNGWVQSVGVPVSGVVMTAWYTPRELGTRYSLWSMAHHAGEGLTFLLSGQLIGIAGSWRAAFLGPALLGGVAAIVLTRTLVERPTAIGLPPVEAAKRSAKSLGGLQLAVLKNPAILACGLASGLVYVSRYALNHWGVFYLQKACHYSVEEAGAALAIFPIAGIPGALLAGPISDRFAGGRRVPIATAYGVLFCCNLALLYTASPTDSLQIKAALAVSGFAMGGLLVFLGGLLAMELCDPRAAGAALGVIGGFSYLGAGIQSLVSGYAIDAGHHGDTYDFTTAKLVWLGAPIAAVAITASLWRAERRAKA